MFGEPETRPIGRDNFTVYELGATKEIIFYQQRPIQVGPVGQGGKLGGGGDRAGGFGHAAEHHFQLQLPGEGDHLVRFVQPRAFHELDINAGSYAARGGYINQALHAFVRD